MTETATMKSSGRNKQAVLHQGQAHSLQAEQAIIGSFLDNPAETYDQLVGKLQANQFMDPFCKLAFEKLMVLIAEGSEPDVVMLASAIDGFVNMEVDEIESELNDIYERFKTSSFSARWRAPVTGSSIWRTPRISAPLKSWQKPPK